MVHHGVDPNRRHTSWPPTIVGETPHKNVMATPSPKGIERKSGKKRTVGNYVIVKRIGSGSFANVWLAHHKDTGAPVAIKSINREKMSTNRKHQENLESEIAIMKQLKHPNIVTLKDVEATERHIYLILEYCAGGDLSKRIKKQGPLPWRAAQKLLLQLGRVFIFAHGALEEC